MENKTYNNWKNYETWNIAHHILGDRQYFDVARTCDTYAAWLLATAEHRKDVTFHGVSWNDPDISHAEIEMMFKNIKK